MPVSVQIGLIHGAVLCGLMTALIAFTLWWDPMIWSRSGPKDLQALVGPPSAATARRKRAGGVVMMVILVAVFGHASVEVMARSTGGFPAFEVALAAWIAFQCFNLWDAVVIDVGLVVFKPRWAFIPGTESLPGFREVRWHVVNYLRGFVGGFVFAGLVTAVAFASSLIAA